MGTCNERDCKLIEMVYDCSRRDHYGLFGCFCLRLLMFSVHLKRYVIIVVPINVSIKQIIHFSISSHVVRIENRFCTNGIVSTKM